MSKRNKHIPLKRLTGVAAKIVKLLKKRASLDRELAGLVRKHRVGLNAARKIVNDKVTEKLKEDSKSAPQGEQKTVPAKQQGVLIPFQATLCQGL